MQRGGAGRACDREKLEGSPKGCPARGHTAARINPSECRVNVPPGTFPDRKSPCLRGSSSSADRSGTSWASEPMRFYGEQGMALITGHSPHNEGQEGQGDKIKGGGVSGLRRRLERLEGTTRSPRTSKNARSNASASRRRLST